jgi:hypothetical protein
MMIEIMKYNMSVSLDKVNTYLHTLVKFLTFKCFEN